ncbi:MAG TPA: putative baseplate assembly protein [Chloroflexota bacterium]|nr:putative baseplate assembly protein [Chloroflexota bacterium]
MSLPVPVLDDRKFQDLVDECKRMIPHFTPEWTDHNVSDPGVTLIELFAWMTELLLYRVNQVPRRNYIKFLELIGISLESPQPARAEILFRLAAPLQASVLIPAGTEVATLRTTTQASIIFATEQPLEIQVPILAHVLVSRDEFAYRDYMLALRNPTLRVPIFEEPPKPDNAFYLGFAGDLAGHTLMIDLDCEIEGIGVDPKNPPLAWEYYDGSLRNWRQVNLETDGTGGLNKAGQVLLHIPLTSRPRELDRRRATWIRCRIIPSPPGRRGYSSSPRILAASARALGGSTMASHSEVIPLDLVGRSDGNPGQAFFLSSPPILPRREGETIEVERETPGIFDPWEEITDFSASGPNDLHFTCDSVQGKIQFGPAIRLANGIERQYGAVPPRGRSIRFTRYRVGGGRVGNVGAQTLTQLKTSLPYVAWVTNPQPAVGGTEAETLDAALMRGPLVLRSSPRAVTAEDFERLAREGSPDVARCRCKYAKEQDDGMAGSVHLVLVPKMPTTESVVPPEELALSDTLRTTVQDFLDARRMITIRMVLSPPQYQAVSVRLEVFAKPKANKALVKTEVEKALYRFVHPTVGGEDGTGWPFERGLFISDIYGLLQLMPNVDHLSSVHFVVIDAHGAERPVTGDMAVVPADNLLCSAVHVVSVK